MATDFWTQLPLKKTCYAIYMVIINNWSTVHEKILVGTKIGKFGEYEWFTKYSSPIKLLGMSQGANIFSSEPLMLDLQTLYNMSWLRLS